MRSHGQTSMRPPAITLPRTSAIVGLLRLRQRQQSPRYSSSSQAIMPSGPGRSWPPQQPTHLNSPRASLMEPGDMS